VTARSSKASNFGIAQGEFVCIVGHSGCGKTTILNVLAGLDRRAPAHVFMDQREVAAPSLERGVVFQGHALIAWLSVRANIAFAVRSKWPDWSRGRSTNRCRSTSAWSGLAGAIDQEAVAVVRRHEAARRHCARVSPSSPRMLR